MTEPNLEARAPRRIKRTVRAAAAAAALTLAGCSAPQATNHSTEQRAVPAASTTLTTEAHRRPQTSPNQPVNPELERQAERLTARAQTVAESYATLIVGEYQKGKSPHNSIYTPDDGSGDQIVNVAYSTGTLVGGGNGEYTLSAVMHNDAQGNLDPKTVSWVSVSMVDNVAGKEVAEKPGDRVTLYDLSLTKSPNGWSIMQHQANKGGTNGAFAVETSQPAGDGRTYVQCDDTLLSDVFSQANTILSWVAEQAPVNYPPQLQPQG